MDVHSRPVVLVSMPWAPASEPSHGLAILRSCLLRAGHSAEVFHANSHFLRWVSFETSQFVADCWGLNEFVFTKVLDDEMDEAQLRALVSEAGVRASARGHVKYQSVAALCDLFLTLRQNIVPDFLDACAEHILCKNPMLVGFTCMFDQTIASAALARLLKRRAPDLRIAMGGYALEGPPGDVAAKAFPWIDYLVRGDGEEAICDLVQRATSFTMAATTGSFAVRADENRPLSRGGDLRVFGSDQNRLIRGPSIDLNTNPPPDYTDWFLDIETLEQGHKIAVRPEALYVENSRGCWWGQHKHCVFCGIDEETLKYRNKSPEVVLKMLHTLRDRHGCNVTFRFTDYIFPRAFYDTLLPKLAEVKPRFRLTGEIKANQTRERMQLFADAGFCELQPGIESFSTPVLRAMDKGVRGIDNVALLKYGYLNRIVIHYNFLFGFPADQLDDYDQMVEQVPLLYHLTPPISRSEVMVTRFAPLQVSPERFGTDPHLTHHDCYDVLFSDRFRRRYGFELDDYCYYFHRNFHFNPDLTRAYRVLVDQINHWKAQHNDRAVSLEYTLDDDQRITICDSRFGAEVKYQLPEATGRAYLASDERPTNISRLVQVMAEKFGYSSSETDRALRELAELRLTWHEDDFIFGIAIEHDAVQERMASQWPKEWTSLYS